MRFSNLSKRIEDYSARSTLTLEEVLGLMKMLCDDVRFESGISVEKCTVTDWELMIDRLYSVSHTVNYIYKKQQKAMAEFDVTSAENTLWQKLQAAEKECGQIKEKLQQLDGLRKQLDDTQAELQSRLAAEKEKHQQAWQVRQQISQLEQELRQLKTMQLPGLEEEHGRLTLEIEQEKQRAEQYRKELETLREKQQSSVSQCSSLREKVEAIRLELEPQQDAHAQLQSQLQRLQENGLHVREEILELQAQIDETKSAEESAIRELAYLRTAKNAEQEDMERLEKELEQARAQKEKDADDRLRWEQQLSDIKKERSELREKCDEMSTMIEANKLLISKEQEECADKQAQLKMLEEQVSKMTACFDGLLSEIQKRKEQLTGMDMDKIEEELRAEQETLQNRIDVYEDTNGQITSIQEQIRQTSEDLDRVQQERDRLLTEKESREAEYTRLGEETEELREALNILDSADFKKRVSLCRNRLDTLRMLQEKMSQSVKDTDCGWTFDPEQHLREELCSAEKTTKQLQNSIQKYAQLWQSELDEMA